MTRSPRPEPFEARAPLTRFVRGHEHPRGVVWFGVRSFWGHLRHFVASAIATEDIDSRDWMTADPPYTLAERAATALGARPDAAPLATTLGRDVWIDFIADTGDDVSVSRKVAELVFSTYELPDPDRPGEYLDSPRGDVLLFGGDTAYPVATATEIANRVLVPFNQVLEKVDDDKPRVLLGIPGNHDWYDGLDGFARLFRRHDDEDDARPSILGVSKQMLEHYAEWAKQFFRGGRVEKPKSLVLRGYTAIQGASFFVLPLTESVHLVGVDRQLRDLDGRQTRFLTGWLANHPEVTPWVAMPDPVYHFGSPSRTGTAMIRALGLDTEARPAFLLSGDVHHYERFTRGKALHVIAGGGGAFLHPAPSTSRGRKRPDVEWPDARQSAALLRQVPWKVAVGRSGFLPHWVMLALFAPAFGLGMATFKWVGSHLAGPLAVALVGTLIYSLIGGLRQHGPRVLGLAFLAASVTALLPFGAFPLMRELRELVALPQSRALLVGGSLLLSSFGGAFVFGCYLALLTRLGYEHTQAFTALDHPGFKHFLRLRVRADGSAIDLWCIGLADPLASDARPVLVDATTFRTDYD
ncbi:MAG: hypothetical protein IPI67_25305 [Myxococcales bacterium]|nr:hypothetical protein [Myxococcales bacterium]